MLALEFWKLSVKSQISYRKDFIVELIIWFFYSIVPFFALSLMLQKYSLIGNLSIGEVAILYGVSQVSYDVARMIGRGFDNFTDLVMGGDFDLYYIRPISILYQILFSDIFLRRLAGIFQGILLVIYGIGKLNIFSIVNCLLFVLIILITVIMFLAFFIINASITLLTIKENVFLSYLLDLTSQIGYYPMNLLKNPIKFVITYIIPIGICVYYPVITIIYNENILPKIIISALTSGTFIILAIWLFDFCKKYYRSVNN